MVAGGKTPEVVTKSTPQSQVTLQINLCAGDLAYAEQTVSALAATHRPDVAEILVVADGCRPHSTPTLNVDERFHADEFARRITKLEALCAHLQSAGFIDRVAWLRPDPSALRDLNRRYCGVVTSRSHDHLGHAFSAYFLGWDAARTRYVAHFDADIVLWQQPGFSWLRRATALLETDAALLAASPRIAPPPLDHGMVHAEAEGSGWLPSWPLEKVSGGWRSPWFSTRCHVMDRSRLAKQLPLASTRGPRRERRAAAIDRALSAVYRRGELSRPHRICRSLAARIPPFPLPPEVLLHEHAQAKGLACLYLDDPRAWFIHPDTKPERFLRLLPQLLAYATGRGVYPPDQCGVSGIRFTAWEAFSP